MHDSHVKTYSLAMVAVFGVLVSASLAGEPKISIVKGWVQAVPPVAADSVGYLTIVNDSNEPLHLTSARTPLAEEVVPMLTDSSSRDGHEMVGMKPVKELTVPAHGTLELKPAGPHLMLMKLRTHPRVGAKVQLILHFEPGAQEVTTTVPVALTQP